MKRILFLGVFVLLLIHTKLLAQCSISPSPGISQIICNGSYSQPVIFGGNQSSGVVYTWSNNTPSIGLSATGVGNIPSFLAENLSNSPRTATVSVIASTVDVLDTTFLYRSGNLTLQSTVIPPGTIAVRIIVVGAIGGFAFGNPGITVQGGKGAVTAASFFVGPEQFLHVGDSLQIMVGGKGPDRTVDTFQIYGGGGGGGGGSFVAKGSGYVAFDTTLVAAGGGGGGFLQRNDGLGQLPGLPGGLILESPNLSGQPGINPAVRFVPGPDGTTAGGGGGYSAGNPSLASTPATGGTSYIHPTRRDSINVAGINDEDGFVVIEFSVLKLCDTTSLSFTVNPTAKVDSIANQIVCDGTTTSAVNFSSSASSGGMIEYKWMRTGASLGIPASGVGSMPPYLVTNSGTEPVTDTITVTPLFVNSAGGDSCAGVSRVFTITVNPTVKVNPESDQQLCSGSATSPMNFSSTTVSNSITYSWANYGTLVSIPAYGSGNIPAYMVSNSGTGGQSDTGWIVVTPEFINTDGGPACPGTPDTIVISLYPTPAVTSVPDQLKCNGSQSDPVKFNASLLDTTVIYRWVRSGPFIGIPAQGLGNMNSYLLTNNTGNRLTDTITVFPFSVNNVVDTCLGTPLTFYITVAPTPNVAPVADQTKCSGAMTDSVIFSGTTSGTVYSWMSRGPSLGIPSNGISNMPAFLVTNSTNSRQTDTIIVTPGYFNTNCIGRRDTFLISIHPTVTMNSTPDQIICSGTKNDSVVFSSNLTGGVVSYSWIVTGATIGIPVSGSGTIPSYILTNTTSIPLTSVFRVTPVFTSGLGGPSCAGKSDTFAMTLNPSPAIDLSSIFNQIVCNKTAITPMTFRSLPIAGGIVALSWTRSGPPIGIGNGGSNSIPAFILLDSTDNPLSNTITVNTVYTNNNGGPVCPGKSDNFTITVNPSVRLNPVSDQLKCNGQLTDFVVFTSPSTSGQMEWDWYAAGPSIGIPASGSGNIGPYGLTNPAQVVLTDTVNVLPSYLNFSGGPVCPGQTMSFTIGVNPTATISHQADTSFCNGEHVSGFSFSSSTSGAEFSWNLPFSIGFGTSGTGSISSFNATNPGANTIIAQVVVEASFDGCPGLTDSFDIYVNPSPQTPGFTSSSLISHTQELRLCRGSENINFNISNPDSGTNYQWFASDPAVIIKNQYGANTVLSFPVSGTFYVSVRSLINNCFDSGMQRIVVTDVSGIDERGIFMKQPGNILVYPDNSMDPVDGYQWGYDVWDGEEYYSAPVELEGAVYQFLVPDKRFFNSNNQLDTVNYAFWVLLKKDGCISRVYYNGPRRAQRASWTPPEDSEIRLGILPNPNHGVFNLSLAGEIYGEMHGTIYNSLGQEVFSTDFSKTTSSTMQQLKTDLPAGMYYITIRSSDLKKVQSSFIILQ